MVACRHYTGSSQLMNQVLRFVRNESGATAIEYGLIAGLISVVIITAVTTVGTNLKNTFNSISNSL
jgi:pilus assembly protein Flp/PilA